MHIHKSANTKHAGIEKHLEQGKVNFLGQQDQKYQWKIVVNGEH